MCILPLLPVGERHGPYYEVLNQQGCCVSRLVRNAPVDLEKIFKIRQCIFALYYLPLKKGMET